MVGQRNNVEFRIIMNDDGTIASNEYVPERYQGLDRFDARKKFIEETQENGQLIKMVPVTHNVGHSERSDAVVEPLLSNQWFVKMDALAEKSIQYQQSKEKINFVPERFEHTFLQWMENIEDWCISRQLWWGHQIPAYYHKETGEVIVSLTPPSDIENYIQDEDVLDTWFSSGLWPFSVLGWPELSDDFKRYFPTDVLVTGYDIIFFWVSRMIFTSLEFLDDKPFKDVLIHGLVRDAQGRKMSKSLGNGVDPMDVIDKYGADSLRYFLTTNSSPGQDLRYIEEKVESTWNFINKLWNASRFVMMNVEEGKDYTINKEDLLPADKWILNRLNETINEVTSYMDKYEFTIVGSELYNFIWDDYCSWYIEMSKATMDLETTKAVHVYVLQAILKMLNPFMPFVTEEIFTALTNKETIINEDYPKFNPEYQFDTKEISTAMELISLFREIRKEYEIKRIVTVDYETKLDVSNVKDYIEKMINFRLVNQSFETSKQYPLSDGSLVDVDLSMVQVKSNDEIRTEYQEQLNKLQGEIKRAQGMLNNEKFTSKAPEAKVAEERAKLADYQAQYDAIVVLMNEL